MAKNEQFKEHAIKFIKPMENYEYNSGIVLRAYPSDMQKMMIVQNDNARRYIYNKCVEINHEIYMLNKVSIFCLPVQDRLDYLKSVRGNASAISNMAPFLYEKNVDSLAKANAIRNYNDAWKRFREVPGTGIPTFKSKSYDKHYQTNAQYQPWMDDGLHDGSVRFLDNDHLKLPVLGRIRVKGSPEQLRALMKMAFVRIGTVTVRIDNCGDCFISLQLASCLPFSPVLPKTDSMIGIDLNIENFFATSNGDVIDNPKYANGLKDKLAKEQWKLSRKMEAAKRDGRNIYDSKNLQKQRVKVAKIQRNIARRRDDYQQVYSKQLVESQDLIAVEDLKVKNMQKNHNLAGSIQDVSWSSFISDISYKAERAGRIFVKIDPKYTTQTCSSCGHVNTGDSKLTLKDREWVCPECGIHHNRDINSAVNILIKGAETTGLG